MTAGNTGERDVGPDPAIAAALGRMAADIASAAGTQICAAYEDDLGVDFKQPAPGHTANSNPVSRIDREVESTIRTRLRRDFPDHAIVGEELPLLQGTSPFTWVIDPIDGTTNFVNGLPLFACSIGVLYRARPIAGAIWCSSTHAFRPGTYHASIGGGLYFDRCPISRRAAGSWRGLAAEPGAAPTYAARWDTRVLGCATVEFAYVAAGLLRIAYIPRPRLWDVVAGICLLHSVDCRALVRRANCWETMLYFGAHEASLSEWSEPLLIGSAADLVRATSSPA